MNSCISPMWGYMFWNVWSKCYCAFQPLGFEVLTRDLLDIGNSWRFACLVVFRLSETELLLASHSCLSLSFSLSVRLGSCVSDTPLPWRPTWPWRMRCPTWTCWRSCPSLTSSPALNPRPRPSCTRYNTLEMPSLERQEVQGTHVGSLIKKPLFIWAKTLK